MAPVLRVRISMVVSLAACGAAMLTSCGSDDQSADCTAVATRCLSVEGFGPARWGSTVTQVEDSLHVHLDCSQGLTPGTCGCPVLKPGGAVTLVFGGANHTLQALYLNSDPARKPEQTRTDSGVGIGDAANAVIRAYPTATLHLQAPITSGLSDFYLFREHGHALAFHVTDGKVSGITGFADGSSSAITSELCG